MRKRLGKKYRLKSKKSSQHRNVKKVYSQNRSKYMRDYRINYGDYMRLQIKDWHIRNPDYYKEWCKKHPSYHQNWRNNNRERYNQQQRDWRQKNHKRRKQYMLSYMKEYRSRNLPHGNLDEFK